MKDTGAFNKKKRDREYIRYFLNGYINYYKISFYKAGSDRLQYKKYKISTMLSYLGIPLKIRPVFEVLSPVLIPIEFGISLIILLYKFVTSSVNTLKVKKERPAGKILMLALDTPLFKLNQVLKCYPLEKEIKAVQIPFIKSETPYETYSLYAGLKLKDCLRAYFLSIRILIDITKKFHRYDFLFRSYASYEFFLACLYVEHSDESNRFLFISTIDRWAYLFGNDTKHSNIFIQHGILGGPVRYYRFKAPHTVYYINVHQKAYFEKYMFIGTPAEINYRPCLEFSSNNKLKNNGKPNLLVICCNNYLDLEKKYISKLATINRYNIYIKPHPGFKDHSEYYSMQEKYNLVVLDREDFPHVDKVLSYESTLASEYEDIGISVLRYNDEDFDEKFRLLMED